MIIKVSWYWHKNRCTNQWEKIHIPDIDRHICSQIISHKEVTTYNLERPVLSINDAGKMIHPQREH